MKQHYVTITGFKHYYGVQPFEIGNLIRCEKEPRNPYDCEAIRALLPMIGTVGYLANSVGTVAGGTMSAGRVYDRVPRRFYVRVCFITQTKIICRLESGNPKRWENELQHQMTQDEDDWDWDEEDDIDDDTANSQEDLAF
ncbi:MAG: HIRAN domain-containing protein [Angelakisella sp.]|nr:HIRAN domain-containing protein [Angelakisella sp.]